MDTSKHSLNALFAQLGLASDEAAIKSFIQAHSPLPDAVELSAAPFWSASQAGMLRDSLCSDGDWAIAVDQLNASLRASQSHGALRQD